MEAGFDEHVLKPADADRLARLLNTGDKTASAKP